MRLNFACRDRLKQGNLQDSKPYSKLRQGKSIVNISIPYLHAFKNLVNNLDQAARPVAAVLGDDRSDV